MSGFSIRLTHKIMAIGIVGLIGLLAFGAIYQIGSWSQDASRIVANKARAISDLNKQLAIEMLEARRAEKDFQHRRDESYVKTSRRTRGRDRSRSRPIEIADANAASSVTLLEQDRDRAGRLRRIMPKNFAGLAQAEIKLGLNETLGLTGSLRAAVHDIETRLKDFDDPRLTSAMLMLRRHEKDFMLRRDEKYVGELKKAAAEFSKSLASGEDSARR